MDALQTGLELFELEEFGDAEAAFRAAIDQDPSSGRAHAYLALCLYQRNELVAAEHTALHGINLDPDLGWAHYVLGVILMVTDRPRLALQSVERSLEFDSDEPLAYCLAASLYLDMERYEPALTRAAEALALAPDSALAVRLYSLAQRGLKDPLAAEQSLLQFLAKHPEEPEVWQQLGWVALELDDLNLAQEAFAKAGHRHGLNEAKRRGFPLYRWAASRPAWVPWLAFAMGFGLCLKFHELMLPFLMFGTVFWVLKPLCNLFLWIDRARLSWREQMESLLMLAMLAFGVYAHLQFGRPFLEYSLLTALLTFRALNCEPGYGVGLGFLLTVAYLYLLWGGISNPTLRQFEQAATLPVLFMLILLHRQSRDCQEGALRLD